MGLLKLLLKVIIVPIVIVVVLTIVIVMAIKMRRERKQQERELQQNAFQPPPITQWAYPDPVQKPAPVVYPVVTPGQMEQGIGRS
ncbi:uncharacterized protein N7459_001930 [Penicillium hispanicum]|uniref:uncharacterized protein n=1 Tax=Penicillium hispanicum TaxID=1080232 RepID=UPI0025400CAA|nr:uncharacterized protein N7459_001930 [Penicillium hispanicum]KAJ5591561.1 hypothetical protein N7459_001930 [Penicillium hispanicum]